MIVAPAVLFGVIAIGWSALWVVASRIADQRIDAWIAAEAAGGRSYTCADRALGGYPFRFTLTCDGARAHLTSPDGTVSVAIENVRATALAYAPRHIILEADGPAVITGTNPTPFTSEVEWDLAQASMRIRDRDLHRLDIRLDRPIAWLTPDGGTTLGSVEASSAEWHLIRDREVGEDAVRVALKFTEGSMLRPGRAATEPADLAFVGLVTESDTIDPVDMSSSLAAWREAGGGLTIDRLKIEQAPALIETAGQLALDVLGRPEGQLSVAIAGIDPAAAIGENAGSLGAAGLAALGRQVEIDGQPAIAVDLTLADGVIRIGPLPLFGVPSLID